MQNNLHNYWHIHTHTLAAITSVDSNAQEETTNRPRRTYTQTVPSYVDFDEFLFSGDDGSNSDEELCVEDLNDSEEDEEYVPTSSEDGTDTDDEEDEDEDQDTQDEDQEKKITETRKTQVYVDLMMAQQIKTEQQKAV